jgi:probable HAF family extracellular repeat protein
MRSTSPQIRRLPATMLLIFWCGTITVCDAACHEYTVDTISLPFCGFSGYGISPGGLNDQGDVTGWYSVCEADAGAFYWSNGALTLVDVGRDSIGGGFDINSKLQIVGVKNGPAGHVGFLYENGKTIDIGMLPGTNFAEAYAINESSIAVGMYNGNKAFIWEDGIATALVPSVGSSAVANDINDNNQIVGWMGVATFPPFYGEAFVWQNGKTTPLGYPAGGVNSEAEAISNNGKVCGGCIMPHPSGSGWVLRAFHWSDGVMQDLGTLPGLERSIARDINNDGGVVGECFFGGPSTAFIWHNDVMSDLNDFIAPDLELELTQGVAINDNGQILCAAKDETNSFVAVLLTPIPSPIGDFNCDSTVNVDDLLGVINNWAKTPPKGAKWFPPGDFDHDGIVELDDLMIVIDNWGM